MKPFLATVPMGRACMPSDVANACCYLGSDEASFITGVELEVSQWPPGFLAIVTLFYLGMFANHTG